MTLLNRLLRRESAVAVIGLGYVGLPLAVRLADHFSVVGYDLNAGRIAELQGGWDRTMEVAGEELNPPGIRYTSDPEALSSCGVIILAVPTPIDAHRFPDLNPLRSAARTAGVYMPRGACVVFESTVYPGATEDVCVPILEEASGMKLGVDFSVGYSPERINPGDKDRDLTRIVKVVSGSDQAAGDLLEEVYGRVVTAGLHRTSSIRVAEAAKVIENTQRDLNIALMNELAMIFDRMGIDTGEVLEAAATKWNFIRFRPGLVGGHCIGVDPYYLTFKAESLGYHPDMILAGRRINDGMGKYISERVVKLLIGQGAQVRDARVAVLGLTFKENVPDLRNTRVVDMIQDLTEYGVQPLVHDPRADAEEALTHCGVWLCDMADLQDVDAVVVAVPHDEYLEMGLEKLAALCRNQPLIVDVKSGFDPAEAAERGIAYWRL